MTKRLCALLAMALFGAVAMADTVYLKTGVSYDGKVTVRNENSIAVEGGGGSIVLQNDEVDRIEKNDKTSAKDVSKFNPHAIQHEKMMEEKTGLTTEQREQVVAIIDLFRGEDEAERSAAIKKLVGMQKEVDIFHFLEVTLSSYGARLLPGVLASLSTIDRRRAEPIIRDKATDPVPQNRAAALEALGGLGDKASVDYVARGLVDEEVVVKTRAAVALAELNDRAISPALIEGLKDNDPRVRIACSRALAKLWSTESEPVQFEKFEEWQQYWEGQKQQVASPIELAQLQPLFVSDGESYVIPHE